MRLRFSTSLALLALLAGCELVKPEDIARSSSIASGSSGIGSTSRGAGASSGNAAASGATGSTGTSSDGTSNVGASSGAGSTSASSSSGSSSSTTGTPFTGFTQTIAVPLSSATYLAAGDLDHDGLGDLVVSTGPTTSFTGTSGIFILKGIDGGFITTSISLNITASGDVAIADWNHDGHPEIFVADEGSFGTGDGSLDVLYGLAGSFVDTSPVSVLISSNTSAFISELAVAASPVPSLYALASTLDGYAWLTGVDGGLNYKQPFLATTGEGHVIRTVSLCSGDFLGDGGAETAAFDEFGSADGGDAYAALELEGQVALFMTTSETSSSTGLRCATAPSGLGQTYFTYVYAGQVLVQLYDQKTHTFTPAQHVPIGSSDIVSMSSGDFDGDGQPDIAIGVAGPTSYIALRLSDGGIGVPQEVSFGLQCTGHLIASDLNGTGRAQLITTCNDPMQGSSVQVLGGP